MEGLVQFAFLDRLDGDITKAQRAAVVDSCRIATDLDRPRNGLRVRNPSVCAFFMTERTMPWMLWIVFGARLFCNSVSHFPTSSREVVSMGLQDDSLTSASPWRQSTEPALVALSLKLAIDQA